MAQRTRSQLSEGKTFFSGFYLYLARFSDNLQVPEAPRNTNPARSITWLVGVTICSTTFQKQFTSTLNRSQGF